MTVARHVGGREADAQGRPPRAGDLATIRRANLSLIVQHLRDHGARSRARLASEVGLSKTTVSTLVGDLIDRGLVAEGTPTRDGHVGRPGLTVALDGRWVAGIGVEINVDYLAVAAVDLRGEVVAEATRPLDAGALPAETVLDAVADSVRLLLEDLTARGTTTVGLTVAAPGMIDQVGGRVLLASNLGWRDVPVIEALTSRLGEDAPPAMLENDAKLGAVAEYAGAANPDVRDLLYITGDFGVGAGVISDGVLLRGSSGFAGEVGHMPLDPGMRPCACGRRGCWETVVGLGALFRETAGAGGSTDDSGRSLEGPHEDRLEDRLAELVRLAEGGDPTVLAGLEAIVDALGTGVSILVDVLNPSLVILGGYFAWFGDHVTAGVRDLLLRRLIDDSMEVPVIKASTLGLTAAARGGALLAVERVFADPTTVGRQERHVTEGR